VGASVQHFAARFARALRANAAQTRLLVILWAIASSAWAFAAALYSYPDIKEEIGQARYFARIAKTHPPMILARCDDARGQENRDFIREDKNPDRCWVDLVSFRRLYPELADVTDERASSRIHVEPDLPMENWEGSPFEAILNAAVLVLSLPALTFVAGWLCTRFLARSDVPS
jgi:hypothetical protein